MSARRRSIAASWLVLALAVVATGATQIPGSGAAGQIVVNDNYASASVVSGSTVDGQYHVHAEVDLTAATVESGEPNLLNTNVGPPRPIAKTAWWLWTAPRDMRVNAQYGSWFGLYRVDGAGFAGLTPLCAPCQQYEYDITSGTTYAIQQGAEAGTSITGSFDFLELPAPPANDDYADATPLVLGVTSPSIDLGGATFESGEPSSGQYSTGSKTAWWSWTASSSGRVLIDGYNSAGSCGQTGELYEVTGAGLAGLQSMSEIFGNGEFEAVAGHAYAFQCQVQPAMRGWRTGLLITAAASPPPNDNLASATPIVSGAPDQLQDTSGATLEANEPLPDGISRPERINKSMWWTITSAADRAYEVEGGGCEGIAMYRIDAPGMAGLTVVPFLYQDRTDEGVFRAPSDGVYAFQCVERVGEFGGVRAAVTAFAAPPPNDDYASAAPLSYGDTQSVVLQGATTEPNEPAVSDIWQPRWVGTAWWVFTAAADGPVHVKARATFIAAVPRLYRINGSGFAGLEALTQNAYGNWDVEAGVSYAVQVQEAVISTWATSALSVRLTAAVPPPGDDFADANPLHLGVADPVDVTGATVEPGEHLGPWYYPLGKTAWWTWTAPADTWLNVKQGSCGDEPYAQYVAGVPYAVYRVDGAGLGGLTLLYEANQPDAWSGHDFLAESGTTYAFQCAWTGTESNDAVQYYGPLVRQLPRTVDVTNGGNAHGAITVTGPQGSFVVGASVSAVAAGDLPPGVVDLTGALSYTIGGLTPGSTVEVTVDLPAGSAPSAAFKSSSGGDYVDVSNLASISGDTVTLTLTDGGAGDSDGAANGTITDPVVLAKVQSSTAPGKPTLQSVTPGNASATVSFAAPASNGGSGITGYTVSCVSSNGGTPRSQSGPSSPIVVSGLTNGKSYTCSVKATNGIGTGPASSASSGFVPATVPSAPTGVQVVSGSSATASGSLRVTFAIGANNGSAITSQTATCTSTNGGVPRAGTHAGATAATVTVTGVTTGRTYRCSVKATNARGTSAASALSASVIVGSPAAPTAVKATRVGIGRIKVTFTPGAYNGKPTTGYTATCTSSNGGVRKSKTGTTTALTVIGLTAGKSYTCSVVGTNARGPGLASTASGSVVA